MSENKVRAVPASGLTVNQSPSYGMRRVAGVLERSTAVEGILNGAPPFRADHVYVPEEELGMGRAADPWEQVHWCVVDAEDSIAAVVVGGEEMAEFIARKLNQLAEFYGLTTLKTDGQASRG